MKNLTGLLGWAVLSLSLWFIGCNQSVPMETSARGEKKSDYYVAAYMMIRWRMRICGLTEKASGR